jgi:hypothetical protein
MHITKPFVVITALIAALAATARKRQAQVDADALWHEATADTST